MPPIIKFGYHPISRLLDIKILNLSNHSVFTSTIEGIFNDEDQYDAYTRTDFHECFKSLQGLMDATETCEDAYGQRRGVLSILSISPSNEEAPSLEYTMDVTTAKGPYTYEATIMVFMKSGTDASKQVQNPADVAWTSAGSPNGSLWTSKESPGDFVWTSSGSPADFMWTSPGTSTDFVSTVRAYFDDEQAFLNHKEYRFAWLTSEVVDHAITFSGHDRVLDPHKDPVVIDPDNEDLTRDVSLTTGDVFDLRIPKRCDRHLHASPCSRCAHHMSNHY